MKKIGQHTLRTIVACTLTLIMPAYSCMITFINDSAGTVAILNHNDSRNKENPAAAPDNFIMVNKGKQRRFNKPHEHAHFSVYLLNKGSLYLAYEVIQDECGDNGNPQVKYSELKDNTIDHSLFTLINKTQARPSMVSQLPIIQTAAAVSAIESTNGGCAACNNH